LRAPLRVGVAGGLVFVMHQTPAGNARQPARPVNGSIERIFGPGLPARDGRDACK
jgi:hypothetical protein